MPSRRYLLVVGLPGHPVSDPHNPTANPARYAGWAHTPVPWVDEKTPPDVDHVLEHYAPVPQVVLDHVDLRKAIQHQQLKLVGHVVAKNHDAARVAFVELKILDRAAPTAAATTEGEAR